MSLMRSVIALTVLLVASLAIIPTTAVAGNTGTRVELFYTDLAPYGRWVEHRVYGMIWVPASGEPGWHPYTYGRWVWTSDYGWYWDSDEDFGWATYHYGRWVLTAEYGWAWVPDDVWGPAWVDWRYGDGYVGWSPMPPEYRWQRDRFVAVNVDLAATRYSQNWVFVSESHFVRGDVRAHRVPPSRNAALLGASIRVTNYTDVNGKIVNRSIDRAHISAQTHVSIEPVRIGVARTASEWAKVRATDTVPLYQPPITVDSELKLNAPVDYTAPAPIFDTETKIAPDAPVGRTRVEGSTTNRTVGIGSTIETPAQLPPGSSIGVGGGLGSGLRLGR